MFWEVVVKLVESFGEGRHCLVHLSMLTISYLWTRYPLVSKFFFCSLFSVISLGIVTVLVRTSPLFLELSWIECSFSVKEPFPCPFSVTVSTGGGIWCSGPIGGFLYHRHEAQLNDFKHILRHHEELIVAKASSTDLSLRLGIWSRQLLIWKLNVNT